jgi:hypothetical protein
MTSPEQPRTPAELCKQAISMANDAQTSAQALRAVTMAIVGLAGEVNKIGKRGLDLTVDRLTVFSATDLFDVPDDDTTD